MRRGEWWEGRRAREEEREKGIRRCRSLEEELEEQEQERRLMRGENRRGGGGRMEVQQRKVEQEGGGGVEVTEGEDKGASVQGEGAGSQRGN